MTFANPAFLQVGVVLLLLVVAAVWSHGRRRRSLAEFLGGRRATRRVSRTDLYRLRVERIVFLGLAVLALAAAAAGPEWVEPAPEPPPVERSVVLAIDISASMQAADVPPSRLTRAVEVAEEMLRTLEGDRVGLLLYAGTAYPLAPPTRDLDALRFLLGGVSPAVASLVDPGTRLTVAIEEAAGLFDGPAPTDEERWIVLIGDGETEEPDGAALEAARAAAHGGIGVHVVGTGTPAGAEVVLPRDYLLGGRLVDASGAPVVSRLDEPGLRRIAAAGGGAYAHAGDARGLRALRDALVTPAEDPAPVEEPSPWATREPTFWLAIVALLCLLVESLLDVRLPAPAPVSARSAP